MTEAHRTIEQQFYAAVICPDCGQVGLTEEQYLAQLSVPDRLWACPKCMGGAEFDDAMYEHIHGIDKEAGDDEPAF